MPTQRPSIPIAALALTLALAHPRSTAARPSTLPADSPSEVWALVDVHVLPMDGQDLLRHQTIVVDRGTIVALGPTGTVPIPGQARLVDGSGGYLVPGLADMHVHLNEPIGARPDLGDGPLFVAHGVTTVLNLSGDPEQMTWRQRFRHENRIAPDFFTSGAFLDEPRVSDPQQAKQEVLAQHAAGVDVVKVHEVFVPGRGYITREGMDSATFRQLVATAGSLDLPVIGHLPRRLPLDTILRSGMAIAHGESLLKAHFLPRERPPWETLRTLDRTAIWVLLAATLAALLGAHPRSSDELQAARWRTAVRRAVRLAGATLAVSGGVLLVLPGQFWGWLSGHHWAILTVAAGTAYCLGAAVRQLTRLRGETPKGARSWTAAVALAALCALYLSASHAAWLRVAWRATDGAMAGFAADVRDSGIVVTPNLAVLDAASRMHPRAVADLVTSDTAKGVRPDLLASWSGNVDDGFAAWRERVDEARMLHTVSRITAALSAAGVPLLTGTDVFGFPWLLPGDSLHRELELLQLAGVPTADVLRAATVEAARFLGHGTGTIAVGQPTDLVLVDGHPLDDLSRLRRPRGVMLRGRWLDREALDAAVAAISDRTESER